jgi:CBS domain-containing protein
MTLITDRSVVKYIMSYDRPQIRIGAVMSTPLETIDARATLTEAATRMREEDIKALIVGRDDPSILTSTDIVRAVSEAHDPTVATVSDLMTDVVETVSPDHLLEEAAGKMARSDFSHLPVVVDGECVGMISSTDITKQHA